MLSDAVSEEDELVHLGSEGGRSGKVAGSGERFFLLYMYGKVVDKVIGEKVGVECSVFPLARVHFSTASGHIGLDFNKHCCWTP